MGPAGVTAPFAEVRYRRTGGVRTARPVPGCRQLQLGTGRYRGPFQNMRLVHVRATSGEDDIDVAVFRFTLGIAGFDDKFIPRVVGLALGAAVGLNHLISTPSEAQARTELIAAVMASMLFVAPNIEERLVEIQPGRGRSAVQAVDGSMTCFHFDKSLKEDTKKELAWASFSLLRNTNCCSVVMVCNGKAVLVRGAITSDIASRASEDCLKTIAKDMSASAFGGLQMEIERTQNSQSYITERPALIKQGLAKWSFVPVGIQSALVQQLPSADCDPTVLLLLSERPRSFSDKERRWVSAIATKLAQHL